MRVFALTLVALVCCASEDVSSSSSGVVGGVWDQGAGPTVGIFRCTGACAFTPYLNAEEICSGTLIAPNLVLTARHCVAPQIDADSGVLCSKSTFGTPYAPDNFVVTPAKDVLEGGPWFIASEVGVPGADGDLVCGSDLAVLELRGAYVGATPMSPRVALPPKTGEKYSAIGYGDDLDGGIGFRHRRDGLTLGCVGAACKLLGPDLAPIVAPSEFLGDTGLCGGDSGGPAVDANGLLVGVTSRANASNCTLPVYTRVDAHAAWLQARAAKAAHDGSYPLPSWAFEALPDDGGADAATFDASPPAFDASKPDAAGASPGQAVGGCSVARGGHESAGFALVLVLLLRLKRRGSRFTS